MTRVSPPRSPIRTTVRLRSSKTAMVQRASIASVALIVAVSTAYLNLRVHDVGVGGSGPALLATPPVVNGSSSSGNRRRPWLRKRSARGRLGNQMFEYASTIGISRRKGMRPCMISGQEVSKLREVFVGPITQCGDDGSEWRWWRPFRSFFGERRTIWSEEGRYATYLDEFGRSGKGDAGAGAGGGGDDDVQLEGFLQSYRYWESDPEAKAEVLSAFRIRDGHARRAAEFLRPYAANSTALVGVHVRRGDMLDRERAYLRVPGGAYYAGAMDRMRRVHASSGENRSLTFVVASEDMEWCRRQPSFAAEDIVFAETGSAAGDFALLTQTDHFILGAGTFSWWGAYLGAHQRGGDVVYFDSFFNMDHKINRGNVLEVDYFPSKWISLSEPMPLSDEDPPTTERNEESTWQQLVTAVKTSLRFMS